MMVNHSFYPVVGGTERQARLLIAELIKRGHSIAVVTIRLDNSPSIDLVEGFPVRRLSCFRTLPLGKLVKFTNLLAALVVFLYLMRNKDYYDIIHVHLGHPPIFGAVMAAKFLRKPIIAKLGNSGYRFDLDVLGRAMFTKRAARFVADGVDDFVVLSNMMMKQLRGHGVASERIHIIPNSVRVPALASIDDIAELRSKLGFRPCVPVALCVARLVPQKNLGFLLDVWARVAKRVDSLLVIVGDGPLRDELETRVATLGLGNAVEFRGVVRNVGDYLDASDVFVLSSDVEGMSNAMLEAMAHGRPCVVPRISGCIDMINNHDNGMLYTCGDADQMEKCILDLLESQALREEMGLKARSEVTRLCDVERIAGLYECVYISASEKNDRNERCVAGKLSRLT